ncbi:MAG: FHA domain-containing protein [Okeania sp. SIO3B3]|nr:FHA domain-containing protein [Okeania sp. SIO3B3]
MVRYIAESDDEFLTIHENPIRGYLTLIIGLRLGHSIPLRGESKMGRDRKNVVVVSDPKVSRHHATLLPHDKTFLLQDQGSANGTFVNGAQIGQPTRLQPDDKISIGDTTFLFTLNEPDANDLTSLEVAAPKPAKSTTASPQMAPHAAPEPPSVDLANPDNRPIWMVIGCMAFTIVILLLALALILGLLIGHNSATLTGLMLLGWL